MLPEKFYFIRSYSSYTSVAAEVRQLNEAKSKRTVETEVRYRPDRLHRAPSTLQQTESFSPLYNTSGNLNLPTCCIYYWGVR